MNTSPAPGFAGHSSPAQSHVIMCSSVCVGPLPGPASEAHRRPLRRGRTPPHAGARGSQLRTHAGRGLGPRQAHNRPAGVCGDHGAEPSTEEATQVHRAERVLPRRDRFAPLRYQLQRRAPLAITRYLRAAHLLRQSAVHILRYNKIHADTYPVFNRKFLLHLLCFSVNYACSDLV